MWNWCPTNWWQEHNDGELENDDQGFNHEVDVESLEEDDSNVNPTDLAEEESEQQILQQLPRTGTGRLRWKPKKLDLWKIYFIEIQDPPCKYLLLGPENLFFWKASQTDGNLSIPDSKSADLRLNAVQIRNCLLI